MHSVIYSRSGNPCSQTSPKYDALQMEKLSKDRLTRMRRYLYCSTCLMKAVYVARAKNGTGPHFRSEHQKVNGEMCAQKSLESTTKASQKEKPVQQLDNVRNTFTIDFASTPKSTGIYSEPPTEKDETSHRGERGTYRRYGDAEGIGQSQWSRRLSTFLKMLIEDDKFIFDSHLILNGKEKAAHKVIYNTDHFHSYEGHMRPGLFDAIFWGKVAHADKGSDQTIWLNTKENDNSALSVKIAPNLYRKMRSIYGLPDKDGYKNFDNCFYILFGKYKKSTRGKPYLEVKLSNPEYIFVQLNNNH